MGNSIADKDFWEKYWGNNRQFVKSPNKMFFDKYLPKQSDKIKGSSFIEIGGFPGTMAAYFYKKYGCEVSLLDFHINENIIHEVERKNGIPVGTIKVFEGDFFNFNSIQLYDIVFSLGFIEHFSDTEDTIKRHIQLLSKNGMLLIVLPNFLGLNGLIQKKFDKENIDAHNLKSMDIRYLKKIMNSYSLKDIKIEYTAKPIVWLEPKPTLSRLTKLFVKTLSYMLKLFPIKCRFLSPYIVIFAENKE